MSLKAIAPLVSLLACGVFSGSLAAQETSVPAQPAPAPLVQRGVQVRSISAYAVYDSSFVPNAGAGFQSSSASLPADVGIGGSIALEWSKLTGRSSVSLDYTPSYTGYVRNSNLNALNHSLSFTASRKMAPRWTLNFSLAGNLSSLEQSVFAPSTLSNVASLPSTFNDLASGILTSKFANNPQLGAILNSSPLLDSPVSNLVYGQRVLTSSASVSVSYSYSPRLSLTFNGGGGRTQYMSGDQTIAAGNTFLISNTTSGSAGMGISYSLSPFTQVTGTVTTNRISSGIFDAYTTTSLAGLGHTFGMHWIVQAHGGFGVTNSVRQLDVAVSAKPRPAAGGSLVYKTLSNTFLGSFDRTVNDSYGLGASSTSSATAGWHWRHPGSSWSLDGSITWQQLLGGQVNNTSGWRASVGLNRAIGPQFVFLTQYLYLNYSGGLLATAYHTSQDAVRVSLVWTPHPPALQ